MYKSVNVWGSKEIYCSLQFATRYTKTTLKNVWHKWLRLYVSKIQMRHKMKRVEHTNFMLNEPDDFF